ncbi:MAG: hypothetical protein AAF567_06900 [Actinomycetota bacterium]
MIGFVLACLIGIAIALILALLEMQSNRHSTWLDDYNQLRRIEDELDAQILDRLSQLTVAPARGSASDVLMLDPIGNPADRSFVPDKGGTNDDR